MKQLLIGDMHVVPEELAECERVAKLIEETARREKPDHIVFLGDQYNNHATVHVRVQEFWLLFFEHLRFPLLKVGDEPHLPRPKVIAIKGNHDGDPTHGATAHALQAHHHQVTVVDQPLVIDGLLFLPYTHDAEEFYEWAAWESKAQGVICHQTFNGCQYENGFYAKDGFDLDRVPQKWIISGHIHKPQHIGLAWDGQDDIVTTDTNPSVPRLWYPGAPRWRSASDANTERGIYLIEHREDGGYNAKRIDTGPVCRRIFQYEVTPARPSIPTVDSKDLVIVDVRGPEEFIREHQPALKAAGARVRSHPTSTAAISIRESEGIAKSFAKHLNAFTPKFGTDKAVLARMAQERLGV